MAEPMKPHPTISTFLHFDLFIEFFALVARLFLEYYVICTRYIEYWMDVSRRWIPLIGFSTNKANRRSSLFCYTLSTEWTHRARKLHFGTLEETNDETWCDWTKDPRPWGSGLHVGWSLSSTYWDRPTPAFHYRFWTWSYSVRTLRKTVSATNTATPLRDVSRNSESFTKHSASRGSVRSRSHRL